jgi:hypothetical protein
MAKLNNKLKVIDIRSKKSYMILNIVLNHEFMCYKICIYPFNNLYLPQVFDRFRVFI